MSHAAQPPRGSATRNRPRDTRPGSCSCRPTPRRPGHLRRRSRGQRRGGRVGTLAVDLEVEGIEDQPEVEDQQAIAPASCLIQIVHVEPTQASPGLGRPTGPTTTGLHPVLHAATRARRSVTRSHIAGHAPSGPGTGPAGRAGGRPHPDATGLHRSAEERRRPRSTAFGLPPPSPVGPPEAACRQGECCSASATARRPTPASNPVIRRAASSGFVATLLRSSRSFAPNLGTSRGQHALLEELDCELGDGVLGGVSLASQP